MKSRKFLEDDDEEEGSEKKKKQGGMGREGPNNSNPKEKEAVWSFGRRRQPSRSETSSHPARKEKMLCKGPAAATAAAAATHLFGSRHFW